MRRYLLPGERDVQQELRTEGLFNSKNTCELGCGAGREVNLNSVHFHSIAFLNYFISANPSANHLTISS